MNNIRVCCWKGGGGWGGEEGTYITVECIGQTDEYGNIPYVSLALIKKQTLNRNVS